MYTAVYNKDNEAKLIACSDYLINRHKTKKPELENSSDLDVFEDYVTDLLDGVQHSIVLPENMPTGDDLIGVSFDHAQHTWPQDQTKLDAHLLEQAIEFVAAELPVADINIFYHEDTDTRAVATLQEWRDFRKDLRNYVQAGAIVGSQPVRPT